MLDLKWLNDCMQAGEFLYGAYPLAVLKKLYETMKGYTVAKRELAEQCEAAEGLLMTYVDAVFPEFEALGYIKSPDISCRWLCGKGSFMMCCGRRRRTEFPMRDCIWMRKRSGNCLANRAM